MNQNNKSLPREAGVALALVLIIVVALVVLASGVSYYLLQQSQDDGQTALQTPSPVSSSDDLDVISEELDQTTFESLEADFNDLDDSAASL